MSSIYVLYFVFFSPYPKKATRTLYSLPLGIISKKTKFLVEKSLFMDFLEA